MPPPSLSPPPLPLSPSHTSHHPLPFPPYLLLGKPVLLSSKSTHVDFHRLQLSNANVTSHPPPLSFPAITLKHTSSPPALHSSLSPHSHTAGPLLFEFVDFYNLELAAADNHANSHPSIPSSPVLTLTLISSPPANPPSHSPFPLFLLQVPCSSSPISWISTTWSWQTQT